MNAVSLKAYEALAVDLSRARPRGLRPAEAQPVSTQAFFWNGWGDTETMPYVSDAQLLGLPAAWACVLKIASAVASMAPPRVVQPDEVTEALGSFPIVSRPNALWGVFDFWQGATAHLLTSGNLVALLADFDPGTGFARQAVPVPTSMVDGHYTDDGFPEYRIGDQTYGPDDLIHVRYLGVPGQLMGVGPVAALRRSIGGQLNQQSMASETYRSGAVPTGVMKVHKPEITKDQADFIDEQWLGAHGNGQRKPAILPELYDFEPIAWSPEDAQFIQAQQFSAAQMAWIFGMVPSDLEASAGGSALTYANLTQRLASRLVEGYGPWIRKLEDGWTDAVPGGNLVRFQRGRFLHASRSDLVTELAAAVAAGLMTADEGRTELGLPPLPADAPPPEEAPA